MTTSTSTGALYYYDTFATPCGPFTAAVNHDGALVATAFGELTELEHRFRKAPSRLTRYTERTAEVRRQILAYFAGDLRDFTLPLAAEGTPFQQQIWQALVNIPFGQTRSYGEIAEQVGNPAASRAVGRANGANPICLIVPCHRVIGANGSMTGFAFGEDIKRQLLAHESV
ncbi:MAG: methylated-DNA--[protein]-cysteine S-methyltransferase [Candidatus Methylacidiphilales bacterium]|nr:methylated-DNA--[protein]-cysteine S-methyltransferase [Candidatus Methylacidiphilales bacterium]